MKQLSAYENMPIPGQVGGAIKWGVVGLIFGLMTGCISSTIVMGIVGTPPPGEESGTGPLLALVAYILTVIGCIAIGVAIASHLRSKKLKEVHAHEAWQKDYWEKLNYIMQRVHETNGDYIAQQDYSQWHGLYRPKANEPVLWMGACGMTEQREKVSATMRVGAVKFAKLPFRSLGYANVEKVVEYKVKYDHLEGEGVLIITPQRVIFVSQGHGQNWSMPWNELMSWQPAINAMLVQPSQGQPKAFVFREAGYVPMQDTQIINAMMEIAHDQ